jgi:hypothetical protein
MPNLKSIFVRPQPEPPVWSYTEMLELMPHILRIAEIYDQCSAGPIPATRHVRNSGVYPYYRQTKAGLILQTNGRFPYSLYTPLGLYNIAPANLRTLDVGRFLRHLTLDDIRRTEDSSIPSLYAIMAVEGVPLPEPEMRDRRDLIPPFEAELSWWSIYHKVVKAKAKAAAHH